MLGHLEGLAGGQEKHGYMYTYTAPAKNKNKNGLSFFVFFSSVILTHTLVQFLFVFLLKGLFPMGLKVTAVFTIVRWYITAHFTISFRIFSSSLTEIQMAVAQQKKQCTMLFPFRTSSNQSSLHLQCIVSENPWFLFAC